MAQRTNVREATSVVRSRLIPPVLKHNSDRLLYGSRESQAQAQAQFKLHGSLPECTSSNNSSRSSRNCFDYPQNGAESKRRFHVEVETVTMPSLEVPHTAGKLSRIPLQLSDCISNAAQ